MAEDEQLHFVNWEKESFPKEVLFLLRKRWDSGSYQQTQHGEMQPFIHTVREDGVMD